MDSREILDDVAIAYDGERCLQFRIGSKHFELTLPLVLDRGVWKAERIYRKNDGVTFGGSYWLATKDDPGRPNEGEASGWRLSVKTGRSGRSSFDVARSLGFSGNEREYLASLHGKDGMSREEIAVMVRALVDEAITARLANVAPTPPPTKPRIINSPFAGKRDV